MVMITLTLTLSSGIQTICIPSPIEDHIELRYASCDYCSKDMRYNAIVTHEREHRFCKPAERLRYFKKDIAHAAN
jgi:hypothetical protein